MRKVLILTLMLLLALPAAAFAGNKTSFNKATAQELVKGTGGIIDEGLAKNIVEYRKKNGKFKTPDDLRKVPGMRLIIFNSLEPALEQGDVIYDDYIPTKRQSY